MNVSDIIEKLELKILSNSSNLESEITGGYTSDLLSDVLGNIEIGQVWITLQTHINVPAVASLREITCVIIVGNHKPDGDMLEKANDEEILILGTSMSAFEISGMLYQLIQ